MMERIDHISLNEHNQEAYDKLCILLNKFKKACVIHPTETGRNLIGYKYVLENLPKKAIWLSPSKQDFLSQCAGLMDILTKKAGDDILNRIDHHTYSYITNLYEKRCRINADIIILEEFHRCGSPKWGEAVRWLLETNENATLIGLSSTEIRYLDNHRNMAEELFDNNIASYLTLSEAMSRNGHLPPLYVVVMDAHENPQLKELSDKAEQILDGNRAKYARGMLDRIMETLKTSESIRNVFTKYVIKTGRYIVFCENKTQFDVVNERKGIWFAGIDKEPHVYTVSYKEASFNNFKNIEGFINDRSEHLKLLLNINMVKKCMQVGPVDGVIMLRHTESPTIYFNQLSLAMMSIYDRRTAIFDVVNNFSLLMTYGINSNESGKTSRRNKSSCKTIEGLEVIDKTVNSRRLFKELQDNLNKDWNAYYLEAKAYYEEHGDLKIRVSYVSSSGLALGRWLNAQKKIKAGKIKGSLSTEQQRLLEIIGIDWTKGIDTKKKSQTDKSSISVKKLEHKYKWYVIRTEENFTGYVESMLKVWIPELVYTDAFFPQKICVKTDSKGDYQVFYKELFGPYIFIRTDIPYRVQDYLRYRKGFKGFVKFMDGLLCLDICDSKMLNFFVENGPVIDYSTGMITENNCTILSGPLLGMEDRICGFSRSDNTATLRFYCNSLVLDRQVELPLRFVDSPEQADDDFPTIKKMKEFIKVRQQNAG